MIIYILGAFLLSLLCGGISTPLVLDFCKRKRLYDIPNERKVHKNATPRLGGITFFPSMLIAFITVLWFSPAIVQDTLSITVWSALFMMGLVIMYFTGIIDDLVGLNATTKFTAQIITACLLTSGGLYFNNLYGLFGIYEIPYYIGLPLTIFMIVFIDNAINLIDGIDGLAASLSLLAMAGFLAYFVYYDVFMNTWHTDCRADGNLDGISILQYIRETRTQHEDFHGRLWQSVLRVHLRIPDRQMCRQQRRHLAYHTP